MIASARAAALGLLILATSSARGQREAAHGDEWTVAERRAAFQRIKAEAEARGLPTSWIDRAIDDLPDVVHDDDVGQGRGASARYDDDLTNDIQVELTFDPLNMSPDDINSLAHEMWHWWFDTVLTWATSPLARLEHWQEEAVAGFVGSMVENGRLSEAVSDAVGQILDENGEVADAVEALYRLEVHTAGESYFSLGFADDQDVDDWIKLIRPHPELRFLEYYLPPEDQERLATAIADKERRDAELEAWHAERERREALGLPVEDWDGSDDESEGDSSRPVTGRTADSDEPETEEVDAPPPPEAKNGDVPGTTRTRTGDDDDDADERRGRVGQKVSRVVPGIKFSIHPAEKRQPMRRTGLIPEPDPRVFLRFSGDRDPTVQLMILDGPSTGERGPIVVPGKAGIRRGLRRLWLPLQRVAHRASRSRSVRKGLSISGAMMGRGGQGNDDPAVQMFLTAVGTTTGEAFQAHFVGLVSEPSEIDTSGLVIEPLKNKAQGEVQKQLRKLTRNNPLSVNLDAYCLELLRHPPREGTMFRVADAELQKKFAPVRQVLVASRQLRDAGLLNPDTDPTQYFHSIRQWAVWAQQENLDRASFGDAFVKRVKQNFRAAGQAFTDDIEQTVRGLVPNRWSDIDEVLRAADVVMGTDR